MRTDLSALPVFTAVAEASSFTEAAEKLHLTRSAISKTIGRLEDQIGTQLFHRTTRNVSLTPEGAQYYEYCKRALTEISAAEMLLDAGRMEVAGRLKISVPVLFGQSRVLPILTSFAKDHPALTLEMSFNDRIVDLIDEDFDIAIRIGELSDRQGSQLVARRLGEHGMKFCAAPHYFKSHPVPTTIEELLLGESIAYARSGMIQAWRFKDTDNFERSIEPKSRYVMDDFQAILQLVKSGIGVAWLPDFFIEEDIARGQIVELLPSLNSITFPISTVWRHNTPLPLKIRLAIDHLITGLERIRF
ncbi:LysR family transcriptional regulator [Brucella anthropi]|uniref:LysR family transcriptional regulator n=1 Tax=Brucella anthropi TaxID=529 RepID=UPI000774EA41|nr:LysR family transcriptional regulator [Brucella anthropi]KXO75855.1 LysR family transcriptional regulator [Brucella anthropi]